MELVGIGHGNSAKGFKVLVVPRPFDGNHPRCHDVTGAVRQQLRRLDRRRHARRGRRVLLGIRYDEYDGPNFRPMSFGCDLFRYGIGPILLGTTLPPSHEAAVQRTTRRSGSLPGNGGQFAGIGFLGVEQFGQRRHEGCVSRGRACQPRRGGEGVVAGNVDVHCGPVLGFHDDGTGVRIDPIGGKPPNTVDAGPESLGGGRTVLLGAVQPEPIGREGFRRRRRRYRA
mmetsp:Transcript_24694/g.54586  ORF Transcript_24694/g.54586 Transcript_24694/m.54586 type:complete len:227 (-) Transcript_24694:214-894(-)